MSRSATSSPRLEPLAARALDWFERHGRKDLPWQHDSTAYRVWISEIMLQQTQVATVIDYYTRFVDRFPDVATLAAASEDDVLALWTGLGYYARARNLHRAAREVMTSHGGRFPDTFDGVVALPGIGRSTAGAILALSAGQRHAILDGNVKRVLARHAAVHGWPGKSEVARRLWQLAESHLPRTRIRDYTQAMMDLGATVCLPRDPGCLHCPIAEDCAARIRGETHLLPGRRPRKTLPVRQSTFLLIRRRVDRALLLERRPPSGIWGGLWCFPQCDGVDDAVDDALAERGLRSVQREAWPVMRHTFSHFHLDITPLAIDAETAADRVRDDGAARWVDVNPGDGIGLAAPVVRLFEQLKSRDEAARDG